MQTKLTYRGRKSAGTFEVDGIEGDVGGERVLHCGGWRSCQQRPRFHGWRNILGHRQRCISIAVEGATDAAQGAAAIVLTSPVLAVIVEAIELSRKIFQRMNNYVHRNACALQLLVFFLATMCVDPENVMGGKCFFWTTLPVMANGSPETTGPSFSSLTTT